MKKIIITAIITSLLTSVTIAVAAPMVSVVNRKAPVVEAPIEVKGTNHELILMDEQVMKTIRNIQTDTVSRYEKIDIDKLEETIADQEISLAANKALRDAYYSMIP